MTKTYFLNNILQSVKEPIVECLHALFKIAEQEKILDLVELSVFRDYLFGMRFTRWREFCFLMFKARKVLCSVSSKRLREVTILYNFNVFWSFYTLFFKCFYECKENNKKRNGRCLRRP